MGENVHFSVFTCRKGLDVFTQKTADWPPSYLSIPLSVVSRTPYLLLAGFSLIFCFFWGDPMLYFHVWELVPNQGKNIFLLPQKMGRKYLVVCSLKHFQVENTVCPKWFHPGWFHQPWHFHSFPSNEKQTKQSKSTSLPWKLFYLSIDWLMGNHTSKLHACVTGF